MKYASVFCQFFWSRFRFKLNQLTSEARPDEIDIPDGIWGVEQSSQSNRNTNKTAMRNYNYAITSAACMSGMSLRFVINTPPRDFSKLAVKTFFFSVCQLTFSKIRSGSSGREEPLLISTKIPIYFFFHFIFLVQSVWQVGPSDIFRLLEKGKQFNKMKISCVCTNEQPLHFLLGNSPSFQNWSIVYSSLNRK